MTSESRTLAPSIAECREELRAVLESRTFQQSQRLARLLQYVCSKAVLGAAGQVTEYTIAVDVFGKAPGFRESKDSIVRVEVHRLRKRLADFYAREGAGHTLRIVIPPGSYAPDFQVCSPDDAAPSVTVSSPVKRRLPSVLRSKPGTDIELLPGLVQKLVRARVPLAIAAIALIIVAAVVWMMRNHRRAEPHADAPAASIPLVPAINTEVHILAGFSGDPWEDTAGRRWQPDRYFKGGVSRPGTKDLRPSLPDHRLFATMREARSGDLPEDRQAFSYDIPMKPGVYELRLYFADPLKESPLLPVGEDGENVRRFTVHANGRALVEQFDAVADAGSSDIDVRAFKDISPAPDGKVHLEFIPNPYRPFVNAIELVPSHPGHLNPIRIAARDSSFQDSDGRTWQPDNYSIGGRRVQHAMPESLRDIPELLREERYGNFSYSIPVPPGSYKLTLYFAETIFSPIAPASMCRGPGCRIFDVTCNGVSLLHDFEVYQVAGGAFRLVERSFHGLHPNGQGKLFLSFAPSVNYAEVQALEVVDEAP